MARIKSAARRGLAGREYRENTKTPEGRKQNCENRKRKRKEMKAAKSGKKQSGRSDAPLAKKAEKTSIAAKETQAEESIQFNSASLPAPSTSQDASASISTDAPPMNTELETTHDATIINIISSSHIQQKVSRALEVLSEYPAIHPAKPKVVILYAKAPIASKLITIAEITKREIVKGGGKWYQYNKLGQIEEEKKPREEGAKKEKGAGEDVSIAAENGDDEGSHESEEEFETMKTPFERAIAGKPKIRSTPVMTLYLSRVRIESLRKEYTEQTNGLEAAIR